MIRSRRRGIALFMVLLTTFVLTMMVGAFFGVNQSNLATLGASFRRKEAMLVAETGINYVRYQLEEDQNWGRSGITAFSNPLGSSGRVSSDGSGSTVKGEFNDGRGFVAVVSTRLGQTAAGDVPADSVQVTCKGHSGSFKVSLSVILKGQPIYDAAASTNGKINMVANTDWQIHSRDPIRNWIRANDDIHTPDILNDATRSMKFYSDVASSVPGVLWSRKDVFSGNTEQVDSSKIADMNAKINGITAPRSTVNNNLYDLRLTDLKVPDNTTTVTIPPGRYVVTEATAVPIKRVDHYDGLFGTYSGTTNDDQPAQAIRTLTFYPQGGGSPTVYYPSSELNRVRSTAGVRPPAFGTEVGGTVNPGGIPGFSYNFDTQKFEFAGNKQYNVDGDFSTGYEAPAIAGLPSVDPDIVFSSGTGSSTPPTFVNVTGNFHVTGTVTGRGALATSGNISFKADADLTAATTDPLVLYSGNNVTIDASGKNDVKFTGLVYAKNEFNVASTTPLTSVNITGSLVARNGGINMAAAKKVLMTYDQAYLEQLTKGLPNGRRRLSQMSWHIQ